MTRPRHFRWRKGWDSNPRNPYEVHSISSAASSTTPAPFRENELLKIELIFDNYDLFYRFDDDRIIITI